VGRKAHSHENAEDSLTVLKNASVSLLIGPWGILWVLGLKWTQQVYKKRHQDKTFNHRMLLITDFPLLLKRSNLFSNNHTLAHKPYYPQKTEIPRALGVGAPDLNKKPLFTINHYDKTS
jgi:hypothetical protein